MIAVWDSQEGRSAREIERGRRNHGSNHIIMGKSRVRGVMGRERGGVGFLAKKRGKEKEREEKGGGKERYQLMLILLFDCFERYF